MNGYIALKNVTLSGKEYLAGAGIPEDAVLPSRVHALISSGQIAKITPEETRAEAVDGETVAEVYLPILKENGVMELLTSVRDIEKAVVMLQMKQDDAIAAVKTEDSEIALILVDACSKSQTLKKAVRERAAQLNPGDGDAE